MNIQYPAPINADHDLSDFSCGAPALDEWLRKRALKNESRFSRTYVVTNGGAVIAYYSISAGSIERRNAPAKLKRNAPDSIPVSIIGRLAVCQSMAGQGLGADILADALRRIASAAQEIGIAAVLIHAKDADAKAFYLKQAEFLEFPEGGMTLFLPMETLFATFS